MKRMFIIALCLALLFVVLPSLISGPVGQMLFYILLAAVGIGMVCYMRWFQKFARQVNGLMPLITENPSQYIAETEKLLAGRRPGNIRAILMMNIATAYLEMNLFVEAKAKLTEINVRALQGIHRYIYALNLAYVSILLNEKNEALELIRLNQKRFLALPANGNLPVLCAFLQIFQAIENQQWETAAEQMAAAHRDWPEKAVSLRFDLLQARLDDHLSMEKTTSPSH